MNPTISLTLSVLVAAVVLYVRHSIIILLAKKFGLQVQWKSVLTLLIGDNLRRIGWLHVKPEGSTALYGILHVMRMVGFLVVCFLLTWLLNERNPVLTLDQLVALFHRLPEVSNMPLIIHLGTKVLSILILFLMYDVVESLFLAATVIVEAIWQDSGVIDFYISYPYLFAILFGVLAVLIFVVLNASR